MNMTPGGASRLLHVMNNSSTATHSSVADAPGAARTRRRALLRRLLELAPAVRRAFEVRLDAEERALWRSLTIHQLEALVVLKDGSVSMRELCDRLEISESAGTALADRLIARGLVERQADPADRRVVRVTASEAARAMVAQYRDLKQQRLATLLADLSTDDLATLVRIHEAVLASSTGSR